MVTFQIWILQIKDKLLKAVDESKKLVMRSFEEKEPRLRPAWYDSLDMPNWHKDHPAMSWDFPKEHTPIVSTLGNTANQPARNILCFDILGWINILFISLLAMHANLVSP